MNDCGECNVCLHGECYACMVGVATGPNSHDTCCPCRDRMFCVNGTCILPNCTCPPYGELLGGKQWP